MRTRTSLEWIPCAVALTVALVVGAWAYAEQPELNGTTWNVNVDPDDMAKQAGQKAFADTLRFADGKLVTAEGQKIGFPPSSCTMARSGDNGWSFQARQQSPSEGTYAWSGTVHGDDVRGKLVWTRKDRSVLTYSFKGDKKK